MRTDAAAGRRIQSIDMLRGLVMLLMLVDHARERFYLHLQVGDPMDVAGTEPALFFTRLSGHLCAPVFVFLTGLSAWLYAHPASGGRRSPRAFLVQRGLLLVLLELTLVNFAWSGAYDTLYLQVIWVIGLCMVTLGLLCALPLPWLGALGAAIVLGHNALTPIAFAPGEPGYVAWTILHDRGWLLSGEPLAVRVSYPLLPWIGVILLGYAAGPLFARGREADWRRRRLLGLGLGALAALLLLRGFNIYGETLPWSPQSGALLTLMDWVNFTKYPPSLAFLLLTLGAGALILTWFERGVGRLGPALAAFGAAPLFFYLLHLYALLALHQLLLAVFGPNQGTGFGVDHVSTLWLAAALLAFVLYWPTRAFARYKRRGPAWLRFF